MAGLTRWRCVGAFRLAFPLFFPATTGLYTSACVWVSCTSLYLAVNKTNHVDRDAILSGARSDALLFFWLSFILLSPSFVAIAGRI